MRRHWATVEASLLPRGVIDRLLTTAETQGAESVIVNDAESLRAAGIDLETILPGARSAITLGVTCPPAASAGEFHFGAQYQVDSLCYDLTRGLETLGFRSLMTINRSGSHPDDMTSRHLADRILATIPGADADRTLGNTVVTRLAIPPQQRLPSDTTAQIDRSDATADLATHLATLARDLGADLVGVAPASRLDELAQQLRPLFETETVLDARDKSIRFTPWEPEISTRTIKVRTPSDGLPGAKSVLVFGLRYHQEVLRHATRPPAEAVGPYAFQTYVTNWLGSVIGYRLVKRLAELGYAATLTMDLTGTDSVTANPRGPQPDLFANRFAGLAAGLGWLTDSGHLVTPQFGIRQRCVAIITDAPLTPSPLRSPDVAQDRCRSCTTKPCIANCPSQAIASQRIPLRCEGREFAFPHIDRRRCDWCKRYALDGNSGFKYLGSPVDLPVPQVVTPEALAAGLRQHDPIKKYRPVVAEPCVINCPLAVE
jgi:epoxyqueuosine reductase QueG